MKIIQVVPFMGVYGGVERFVYFLSRELVKRGHDIHIFSSRKRGQPSFELLEGIKIHRFFNLITLWNSNPLPIIFNRLMREEFDICHAHSYIYFSTLQASLVGILRRKPLILTIHGGITVPNVSPVAALAKSIYDETLARITFLGARKILSVSNHDLKYLNTKYHIPREKLAVVPPAIDRKLFEYREERNLNKIVLYVGDLEPWKGVNYLLESYKLILRDFTDVSLLIAGDGSERYKMERDSKHIKGSIKFLGSVPHNEIPQLMHQSSVLVLPSLTEGIPLVLLEAMSSGLPIVATDVGGIGEIEILRNMNLLVPPSDSERMASAIKKILLAEPQTMSDITKKAREYLEKNYDIQAIAEKMERIYEEEK